LSNRYIVVFGHDADGNPRACRFTDREAALASKAAHALGYRTLQLTDPELANQLPLGSVFVRGPAFIRRVNRMTFDRLCTAAGKPTRVQKARL
jgi:hypothetical protein